MSLIINGTSGSISTSLTVPQPNELADADGLRTNIFQPVINAVVTLKDALAAWTLDKVLGVGSDAGGKSITNLLSLTTTRLSGSHTKLSSGVSAFVAGTNVTISTGSNEQITFAAPNLAPVTATYVTLSTDATLSNERVLTAGTGIRLTDAGAGSTVTAAINDGVVATVSGTTFTGLTSHGSGITGSFGTFGTTVTAQNISGSHTRLHDGKSAFVAGNNMSITTGTNGQVTFVALQVGCALSATQNSSTLNALVTWDTEIYDTSNMCAAGSTDITIPQTGVWEIFYSMHQDAMNSGIITVLSSSGNGITWASFDTDTAFGAGATAHYVGTLQQGTVLQCRNDFDSSGDSTEFMFSAKRLA